MQPKRISPTRILAGLSALFLWACPTDPKRERFDYLRQVITFRVDTVRADHPFCADPGKTPFATEAECRAAKKYRLTWEPPEDTAGFTEYRVYLDTTPPDAGGRPWEQVRRDRSLAAAFRTGSPPGVDSLIFAFLPGTFRLQESPRGPSILAFDTAGRIDSGGRLVFAILTAYRDGGIGAPKPTWLVTNDRSPPHPIHPRIVPLDRRAEISWSRPLDPTSFFDPGADSGIIREYVLRVVRSGLLHANRPGTFDPRVRYEKGGTDQSASVKSLDFVSEGFNQEKKGAKGRRFTLPDSLRIFDRRAPDPRDSLKVWITGLEPADTVDVFLWAVDSAGNHTDTTLRTFLILTDTTEPVAPVLRPMPGGVNRNQIAYAFTASRDRVERNGTLAPADSPNANIKEYRLRRVLLSNPTSILSRDSVIPVTAARRGDTLFSDTVRHLPPGARFRVTVQAVDSSGYLSPADSLDLATDSVRFAGADSGATCPPGFVPMPAGSFTLGDSAGDADEKPARSRFHAAYCIEPTEHKDSTGRFAVRATWQQAARICRDLSPADSTHLCTEAEWERACKTLASPPLRYGVQSERVQSGETLLNQCNVGAGDSAMALNPALRHPSCLTGEGVFDLPGNLSEWVLDPYDSTAYSRAPDTLRPGQTLAPQQDAALHGFRGWHYLDTLTQEEALRHARCSNRDYNTQVRPRPFRGCVDADRPLLVLRYNLSSVPRCVRLPDSLHNRNITDVLPSQQDSTQLLVFLSGVVQPVSWPIPPDTAYRNMKPVDARFTPLALAAVTFENSETGETLPDTLDALEMRDTSQARLALIFAREAAPPWSVRRENGRFAVRFLYAHSELRSVPAKPHYSNEIQGFRCCSLPRRPMP